MHAGDIDPRPGAEGTDPERSDPTSTDPKGAGVKGADVKGADVKGADLKSPGLKGADPRQADLEHADLEHTDLEHTDPEHTNPEHTALEHTDLEQTALEKTDPKPTAPEHANANANANAQAPPPLPPVAAAPDRGSDAAQPVPARHVACENCGAPLQGEFCHACGQSLHNPTRHFRHAMVEVFEAFWHLDGRVFRTLRELVFPGRVAINYLAGQRARYIAPLRLFVVLSVLTFFIAQLLVRVDTTPQQAAQIAQIEPPADGDERVATNTKLFAKADSVLEVERLRLRELADLQRGLDAIPSAVVVARRGIEREMEAVNRGAAARIDALRATQSLSDADIAAAKAEAAVAARTAPSPREARDAFKATLAEASTLAEVERLHAARTRLQRAQLDALPAGADVARRRQLTEMRRSNEAAACRVAQLQIEHARTSEGTRRRRPAEDASVYGDPECAVELTLGGDSAEPWDEETNPARIDRAPAFVNRWLNRQIALGRDGAARAQKDPELLVRAMVGAVPGALFLMVPVFALLLKLAYLGSGRRYLEHLVVALYSHAYLLMAMLALFLTMALDLAIKPYWDSFGWITGTLQFLLWLWLPIYLLLMQKRVYRNGWIVTLLRYLVIGNLYFVLVGFAMLFIVVTGLTRM